MLRCSSAGGASDYEQDVVIINTAKSSSTERSCDWTSVFFRLKQNTIMKISLITRPDSYYGPIALIVAAVLTGCGGGGDSNTGSGTEPGNGAGGNNPGDTVGLFEPQPSSVQLPRATGDIAADAFNWMNYRRAQNGLPAVERQTQLDQAAAAHANYIALNGDGEGHDETPGKPGFTGAKPIARTQAAGYTNSSVSENIAGGGVGVGGSVLTDVLLDAPYHRSSQLNIFTQAGVATRDWTDARNATWNWTSYVINFGAPVMPTGMKNKIWTYPRSGQVDAYLDWMAYETPNPIPDYEGKRVGYPITLHAPGQNLRLESLQLMDSQGAQVAGRLVSSMNGAALRDYAIWIPLAALNAGTTYTAHAKGTLEGKAYQVQWSFKTLPDTALQWAVSPQGFTGPESVVTLALSGGTGRYAITGYSLLFYQNIPNYPSIVGAAQKSANEWAIKRDNVQCPPSNTPCGELTVKFSDTAGHEGVVVLLIQ
jgi:uncharacterized protein YkwD